MAMSMKSLLTQSDDDEDGDDADKIPPSNTAQRKFSGQHELSTGDRNTEKPIVKASSTLSLDCDVIPTSSLPGSRSEENILGVEGQTGGTFPENLDKQSGGKSEESKTGWFRVTDSLKKLSSSSRRGTSSSIGTSLNETFDGDYFKAPLTKTCSEHDVNTVGSMDNIDVGKQNHHSKSQWIKGHLSSYLSKSKNYYHNRGGGGGRGSASLSTSEDGLHQLHTDQHNSSKEMRTFNTNNESTDNLYDKSKTTDSIDNNGSHDSSTKELSKSPLPGLNTLTSDDSHLPLMPNHFQQEQKQYNTSETSKKNNTSKVTVNNKNTKKNDARVKTKPEKSFKTNLSLSELLQSQRSFTSPTQELNDTQKSTTEQPVVPTLSSSLPTSLTAPVETSDQLSAVNEEEINILTEAIVNEDLKHHFKPSQYFPITFYQLWITSNAMFFYLYFHLPPYISGFITGGLTIYLLCCMLIWFFAPSGDAYNLYRDDLKKFLLANNTEKEQSEIFKNIPKAEVLQKPRRLKLWMSLSYEYDGTFEKELTKEIYAVVDSETLYLFIRKQRENNEKTPSLSKKQLKRETKKAAIERMEKEMASFVFESQVEIDLRKCSFFLKPDDLPIRRMWNKKYPMKLVAPPDSFKQWKIDYTLEKLQSNLEDILDGIYDTDIHTQISVDEEQGLYLFANSGREKEDWFYRIQLCIQPLKHQVSYSDIRCQRLSKLPKESYPHYMTELMRESERVMQRHVKGKKVEPHLAWLNIFLGRAFWDFWHDKYWTDKLHQKIQNRFSKINTPPFITNITLKDLNCGHNIPIIHKGSVPTLDEYGVWTDLQITYKGYFTLTIETQLNVDYYVNLLGSIVKEKGRADPKNHSQLSKLTKLSALSTEDVTDSGNTSMESGDAHTNQCLSDTFDEDVLNEEIQRAFLDDSIDHADEMDNPMMSDPRTKAFLESKTGKTVVGVVGWLAKSKIAKRVAETDFAKKAYGKAYEKFRKMPIILKVEIQSVKGNLAVNIPPPPTNRLWFGFRGNPVIFITASPKIGEKQVRLTYLTNWIEKKIKEEFKKYLVLPSMQDLSIKLMDSQLSQLNPERPTS